MKKLISLIALSIITLIATAQIDTTGMSDYEKYYYIQTGEIDTTKKVTAKVENDDLYYQASKDEKQVTTIFSKKPQPQTSQEQQLYNSGYGEGYEEGVEDVASLFDDEYTYANMFYRFNYGFGFSYYSPYWMFHYGYYDPFYYSWGYPYYYDPFYYSWGYPYYGYGYSYYDYGYPYYPYYGGGIYYTTPHPVNSGYGIMGSRHYGYSTKPTFGTKEYGTSSYKNSSYTTRNSSIENTRRANTLNSKGSTPMTQTRTIANTSSEHRTNMSNMSRSVAQEKTNTLTQGRKVNTITSPNRSTTAVEKPSYNSTQRTYTPSYNQPHMTTRPQYNNANTQKVNSDSYQMRQPAKVQTPSQQRTTTQTRSYSTPSRNTYSAPSKNSSSYSTPSRSSYSTPSKGSSSYSSPSRSNSSGSSYSGGSSSSGSHSSGSNSSSGSSHGRR